jgi:hypothetical protein
VRGLIGTNTVAEIEAAIMISTNTGWSRIISAKQVRTTGGFTSDSVRRVNSRGEFESISLRGCNPMAARAGSPLAGRNLHPLDGKSKFHEVITPPFPFDQQSLVAL